MSERPDLYAVLGVRRDAESGAIRRAYREQARAAHPDLVGETGLATMRLLNAAWDTLSDPVRRAEYDSLWMVPAVDPFAGGTDGQSDGPAWTGAAGPPPGRPSGSRITFGLYAGWTLGEIARHDNGYLMWLLDRPEGRSLAAEIGTILDAMRPPEEARNKNRWRG